MPLKVVGVFLLNNAMKLIFIKDVVGVAKRDEVREVKDGFAQNFLLPKGLAVPATSELIAKAKARAASAANAVIVNKTKAEGTLSQIKGKSVKLTARASANGKLYSGIGAEAIAQAISEQFHVQIHASNITLPTHIKSVGAHNIVITLNGVTCAMSVSINQA